MLNKKNALITGGAGLLGPQHALALNELGFNIVLIDINKKNLLKTHNKLKRKVKKNTHILSYHLIDVLVNNAEINPKMKKYKSSFTGRVEDYSIKGLVKELGVGIIGTFICSKIFGEHMKIKKKGSIINISSDLGITAPDQRVYHLSENINKVKNFKPIGYTISKHAIIGITKYLATYWAHKNIRCNTLVPGAVFNNQPKFLKKNVMKRIPLNRWANVTEYKKAIQFLATDDSCYMTGQSLIMDGGRTVW